MFHFTIHQLCLAKFSIVVPFRIIFDAKIKLFVGIPKFIIGEMYGIPKFIIREMYGIPKCLHQITLLASVEFLTTVCFTNLLEPTVPLFFLV
jgi:hypothetical protein